MLSFNVRVLNNLFHRGESVGQFQMMRKETFDKLGGFRTDLVTREDTDMFLRLSQVGRIMLDPELLVYHSGRRAHKIGWTKLLWDWVVNTIWVALFDKAFAREWKVIRWSHDHESLHRHSSLQRRSLSGSNHQIGSSTGLF